MDDPLDEALRRKLVCRRGRLHAFPALQGASTALVAIDAVDTFLGALPEREAVVGAVGRVAAALRRRGGTVAWVVPTPPATWPSAAAAAALLGAAELERYRREIEAGRGALPSAGLPVEPGDPIVAKRGYSAFFPGNCALPGLLRDRGIDTVLLAGALTHVCVEASARDAFESGFRVVICADGVAAGDPVRQRASLGTLARTCADVRTAADLAALLDADAGAGSPRGL